MGEYDDMEPDDDDRGAAELLCRLQMLLEAAAAAPGDSSLLEVALVQAAAATGADSVVLGTMRGRDIMDVVLLSGAGEPLHDVGALQVSPQYPLTDVVVRERAVWLGSLSEIRNAYPTGGMLWGRSFACVPLLARGVAVGAIGLIHDVTDQQFTAVQRVYLSAVADLCVTVLAHPSTEAWPPGRTVPAVDL